jgi:hypothetical protein
MGSIKLFLILLVLGGVGAGYVYVQNLQKNLEVAVANNARLETAVATNEATIDALQEDYARIQTELNRVNTEFAATRAQNNLLRDRLSNIDLGLLAQTRPDSIERAVNRGTVNAGRCFEILSGSPLTDQEREATSGDEFNRECPWLWPGVDAAQ